MLELQSKLIELFSIYEDVFRIIILLADNGQ